MASATTDHEVVEHIAQAVDEHFGAGVVPRHLCFEFALAEERLRRIQAAVIHDAESEPSSGPQQDVGHDARVGAPPTRPEGARRTLNDRYLSEAMAKRRKALARIFHHLEGGTVQ
jgi:hypothetical protein